MKLQCKICGISDPETLKYIVNHPNAPAFVGFIVNYKKSKRFINSEKLIELLKVEKKSTNYVAVLVKPTKDELEKIKDLNFEYYQIYDLTPNEIEIIKKKYNIKIIVALKIETIDDVLNYKNFESVADIILFDSQGYEKSLSFDHKLIKNLRSNIKIMLAGNIQIDDNLESYNKITDIIDISGGLETSGLKDISKINIFLNKIKQIKNET
jgi:phosphoribosylanthranilate isomerase|tara:strand:+ start:459 stop:1088 length:630 start_codon:yes stop_codon:yes gene_type:complete